MKMLRKMLKQKNKKGFTLIEILITVLILSFGILGALLHFTQATAATELARDMTTAVTHAEYILEEMKAAATLATITSTNWSTRANTLGLNILKNEIINVTYANPSANPLNITVTVNWTTKNKTQSINLVTELTK